MARIYLSALINRISGRLGDVIYGQIGGQQYVRLAATNPADPLTARKVQIRANFSAVAAAFNGLTAGQKDLWREYSNLKRLKGGARAAHRSLTTNLLNASHSDLVARGSPPHTPHTPRFPKHFCVTQIASNLVCLSWQSPSDTNTYITGHFRTHYGFCKLHPCYGACPTTGVRRDWRFGGTARADTHAIQIQHDWPANTRLFYRLNSIDTWGRKSPLTHELGRVTRL